MGHPTSNVDDTAPEITVSEPTPAGQPAVSITQADLDALLAKAVQAGAAQAAAHFSQFVPSLGAPAVDAEKPEEWTKAELWRKVLSRIVWHNEREVRAAQLALDNHYPAEDDEEATFDPFGTARETPAERNAREARERGAFDNETPAERAAREAAESRAASRPRTTRTPTGRTTRDV